MAGAEREGLSTGYACAVSRTTDKFAESHRLLPQWTGLRAHGPAAQGTRRRSDLDSDNRSRWGIQSVFDRGRDLNFVGISR
jgi:hypothetical protein